MKEDKLSSEWDCCLIGYEGYKWVYDISLMIDKVQRDIPSLTRTEALEWIEYNIIGFAENGFICIDDCNYEFNPIVFKGEEQ